MASSPTNPDSGGGIQVAGAYRMRHVPRLLIFLLAGIVLLGPAKGSASATSIEDLIKLKANKATPVSDDVLIALIESDGSVFHLTADDILPLKQKGLSDKLIIAMLLTATRVQAPADVVEPPAVEQPYSLQREPGTPVTQLPPVVVNVTQQVTQTVEQPAPRYQTRTAYVPVYVPVAVPVVRQPPPPPVYWGWGGQRRPDAWAPDPQSTPDKKPDPKLDPKKVGGGQ
jgi:hypothetical protein